MAGFHNVGIRQEASEASSVPGAASLPGAFQSFPEPPRSLPGLPRAPRRGFLKPPGVLEASRSLPEPLNSGKWMRISEGQLTHPEYLCATAYMTTEALASRSPPAAPAARAFVGMNSRIFQQVFKAFRWILGLFHRTHGHYRWIQGFFPGLQGCSWDFGAFSPDSRA